MVIRVTTRDDNKTDADDGDDNANVGNSVICCLLITLHAGSAQVSLAGVNSQRTCCFGVVIANVVFNRSAE